MNQCQITKGFIFLRNCSSPAVTVCQTCGKSVCSRCLVSQQPTTCVQCHSTSSQDSHHWDRDRSWSYRYRDSYYGRSGWGSYYTPYYGAYYGSTHYSHGHHDYESATYDESDGAGLESAEAMDIDDGDNFDPDLMDS